MEVVLNFLAENWEAVVGFVLIIIGLFLRWWGPRKSKRPQTPPMVITVQNIIGSEEQKARQRVDLGTDKPMIEQGTGEAPPVGEDDEVDQAA